MDMTFLILLGLAVLIVAVLYEFGGKKPATTTTPQPLTRREDVISQATRPSTPHPTPYPAPSFTERSVESYPQGDTQPYRLRGNGHFELAAVGESNYQRVFAKICGPRTEEGEDREVEAQLSLEDTNQFDNQAVKVTVQGQTVGYLSRDDARDFRDWLTDEGISVRHFLCNAHIRGGWDRDGERGHYGIWLDVEM